MAEILRTVTLDKEKCKGCIACMNRCPTEAIRVREGKARVHYEKCVGCGECVRICPNRAKKAVYDSFEDINKFKYKVALPAPALFGQFNNLDNLGLVIAGLKRLGFDKVVEVAKGAELISDATRQIMREGNYKKPLISTACPAILQLILLRYHDLVDNLLDLQAPVDIAAKIAREEAVKESGLKPEEIGIFFISPCPAKVFALKNGLGLNSPAVDGVLAISEVYFKLIAEMKNIEDTEEESTTGIVGIAWASSGGEAAGVLRDKYIAADGIENCINILKELEHEKLNHIEFVELNACTSGCVGGVMNIENPFVARSKIRSLRKYLPVSKNKIDEKFDLSYFKWECNPEKNYAVKLDQDIGVAIAKMATIDNYVKQLPALDCGLCGAPSCRAFAEDIVNGEVDSINDCPRLSKIY